MENKGYVMGGLAFLLIVPSILLLMVFVDMVNLDTSVDTIIKSGNSFYISGDVERNIPMITRQVLKETVDNAVNTGNSLPNSRIIIKNAIERKMNNLSSSYQDNTGVNIRCTINSIESASNPFEIEVNSTILIIKDNITYNNKVNQNISILETDPQNSFSINSNGSSLISDPLPFIKCKKFGGVSIKNGRISYGSSLKKYLGRVNGSEVYENASSPFYIKKCPYDPYKSHGNSINLMTLKNCIYNGYYHESNDGACLLCRLEGHPTCNHYGFETFIVPSSVRNQQTFRAPSSIDHLIFDKDNYKDPYPGESVQYNFDDNIFYVLYLDNGHRAKYGLQEIK
jgi:hypothetical protein